MFCFYKQNFKQYLLINIVVKFFKSFVIENIFFNLQEHQKQKCDVTMIEQALTIATSSGTSEARIQIPSSLQIGSQQITITDHQIPVDGTQMNITVEHVNLTGLFETLNDFLLF